MARIRTIKPEFCTSAQVVECSRDARLLFVLMWMFCDDYGIHPANAKQLKMECFPGDDVSSAAVQTMIDELIRSGLLTCYTVDGCDYWKVTGWHHQRIDKRQPAKYPSEPPAKPAKSASIPRAFQEHSKNGTGTLQEHSKNTPGPFPPERKGKERKGKEDVIDNLPLIGSGNEELPGASSGKKSLREPPEPRVRAMPPDWEDDATLEARRRALVAEMKADLAREAGIG